MIGSFNRNHPFFLSLSGNSLQVVNMVLTRKFLKMEGVAFGKIPLDAVRNGEIVDIEKVAKMVQVLTSYTYPRSTRGSFCYLNISDKFVFSKFLALPKVSDDELEQAIKFKIKNFLPHPPESLYFDWQIVEESEKKREVLVITIEKRIIDSYFSVFKLINVYPLAIEPESLSLARLIASVSSEPNLVIYFNQEGATFCFVEKGSVLFVSTIDFKQSDSLFQKEIIDQLEKMAKFWQEAFSRKRKLKGVYVDGLVSLPDALVLNIKKIFGFHPQPFPVPFVFPASIPQKRCKKLLPLIGLSLRLFKKEKEKSFLIPPKVQEEREFFKFKIWFKNILKINIFYFSFLLALFLFMFLNIFFQREKTKAALSGLQKIIFTPQQTALEKRAVELNQKISILQQIIKKKQSISGILEDFFEKIPAGIKITEVVFDSQAKTFKIKGEAASREDILSLEKELSSLGEVTIPLSSFEESKNAKFQAIVKVRKGK